MTTQFKELNLSACPNLSIDLNGTFFYSVTNQFYPKPNGPVMEIVTLPNGVFTNIPIPSLVAQAWYTEDEQVWKKSMFADVIQNCCDFNMILPTHRRRLTLTNALQHEFWITDTGELWNATLYRKVKTFMNSVGYMVVSVSDWNYPTIHRLVAESFLKIPKDLLQQGYTPQSLIVNHLDGVKTNNKVTNLEWATRKRNALHAAETGLRRDLIPQEKVEEVWKLLSEGYTNKEIAEKTGIPLGSVSTIRQGHSSRHITNRYSWRSSSNDKEYIEFRNKQIIDLYKKGKSLKEIVGTSGLSENTIVHILKKAGIYKPRKMNEDRVKISDELAKTIFEMLQDGVDNWTISRETGVPVSTIANIRARRYAKHDTPDYSWPMVSGPSHSSENNPENIRKVVDVYNSGNRSIRGISKATGIHTTAVSIILRRHTDFKAKRCENVDLTDELLEDIFKLLQEGLTNTAIQQKTNIPARLISSIRQRITPRYDPPNYTWRTESVDNQAKEERNKRILELYDQYHDATQVAKMVGNVSSTTVGRVVEQRNRQKAEEAA